MCYDEVVCMFHDEVVRMRYDEVVPIVMLRLCAKLNHFKLEM